MEKLKSRFRFIMLSTVIIAVVLMMVATMLGSRKPADRLEAKDIASPGTGTTTGSPISNPQLENVWLPENLTKQEEMVDQTFGRVLTYSNGNNGARARTIWLQTWNLELETVQAYGGTKSWWLDTSKVTPVTIGKETAEIESQIDPGGLDGSPPVQWHRLVWSSDGFGYRVVTKNITQDELVKIANSLSPAK